MNKTLIKLIKRNIKLFFKDKAMFLVSLITPVILLVLYASFLGNVYKESFIAAIPQGLSVSDKLIDGFVGGQLISSILAVCCVTVAFCSNMLMVTDKATGALQDLTIAPVKSSTLALSYYISTLVSSLIICYSATVVCCIYVFFVGWFMSFADLMFLLLDVFLIVLFGTAFSSIIGFFLSSQGQISAVGTIISSGYGFICGAYMPISQFSEVLQTVISFLPGTYGTSLVRNHALSGVMREMKNEGLPSEFINSFRDEFDCNIYFFENKVDIPIMYLILGLTVALLIAVYVLMNRIKFKSVK